MSLNKETKPNRNGVLLKTIKQKKKNDILEM